MRLQPAPGYVVARVSSTENDKLSAQHPIVRIVADGGPDGDEYEQPHRVAFVIEEGARYVCFRALQSVSFVGETEDNPEATLILIPRTGLLARVVE